MLQQKLCIAHFVICKCRPFVFTANGYCRSEAIVAVYLQKRESSRRIYATLIHSKTNTDGYKDKGTI